MNKPTNTKEPWEKKLEKIVGESDIKWNPGLIPKLRELMGVEILSARDQGIKEGRKEVKKAIVDKFGLWGDPVVSSDISPLLKKLESQ